MTDTQQQTMQLGYNTNGFAHHDLFEAVEVLQTIGYRAIGLTIEHGVLSPRDAQWSDQAKRLRDVAQQHALTLIVETGARYLLDPWVKHKPVLVSSDPQERQRRVDFLLHALEAAKLLGAGAISLWAGIAPKEDCREEVLDRLAGALLPVLEEASRQQISLALEPEPGMAIERLADYAELKERLAARGASTERFRLTADIGHLHCLGETPIAEHLAHYGDQLENIHIEDMVFGVHEHLEFGQGQIDFPPIVDTLARIGYGGPLCVELSRHSHDAPEAARRALAFLAPLIEAAQARHDHG